MKSVRQFYSGSTHSSSLELSQLFNSFIIESCKVFHYLQSYYTSILVQPLASFKIFNDLDTTILLDIIIPLKPFILQQPLHDPTGSLSERLIYSRMI